jgi:hypothetical protein
VSRPNINFVIARTDKATKRPYFDDLSHHNLAVAFSQLHTNDSTAVMSGLLHDFFKGLFAFDGKKWEHIARTEDYEKIIPDNISNINKEQVIDFVINHHQESSRKNPIRFAEGGKNNFEGIAKNLESRLFISDKIYGLDSIIILPKSRYHWLLISAIHHEMKKYLSNLYIEKIRDLLNISSIEFRYIPVSFSNNSSSLTKRIEYLDLENYQLSTEDERLVIPLPIRDLKNQSAVIYNGSEEVFIDENTITIPFGEALTLFAFSKDGISLSYVDPGFDVDLSTILERILEKDIDISRFPYGIRNIKFSLSGKYQGPKICSFCGSPASRQIKTIVQGKRFTDINLLLDDSGIACPVCYAGYLLEESNRCKISFIEPQDVELYDLEIPSDFRDVFSGTFRTSASGLMWQQVLSILWYHLYINEEFLDFVLDPYVVIHPLKVRFVPRALFSTAWKQGRKKYCLQSTIQSELTVLGSEANISLDEFKELNKAYRNNKEKLDKSRMLKKIKSIYGTKKIR